MSYMLDFLKIKVMIIFRAREIGNPKYVYTGIYCNENFKNYIEESDLKGYKFIEIRDINDGVPIPEKKKNIFLWKNLQENFIQMGI